MIYNGVEILLINFTETRSSVDVRRIAEESIKITATQPQQSQLGLVDLTGCPITSDTIAVIKKMAAHNRPYIKFVAIVGLPFPRSMMLTLMLKLTGRKNHRVFRKRLNAMEWLTGKA
ncbi:MAG: hypothetical protein ABSD71_09075 [Bacteroidales bacterium]|jgi:hypothetical protein